MINIATKDLKEFFKLSSKIGTNQIIPVLSYIKIECLGDKALLTKTNLNTYCIHEIGPVETESNETVLVDERLLSIITQGDASGIISIKLGDRTTYLTDGATTLSFSTEDPVNFPETPKQEVTEMTLIDTEVLESIGLARHYMHDTDDRMALCFVVPEEGKSVVFATDRAIFYLKSFPKQLPTLCLTKDACSIISMFNEVQHYPAGNYDFFTSGRTTLGLIKSEYKALPYKSAIGRAQTDQSFTANIKDISSFCDAAASATVSMVPLSSWEDSGEALTLRCVDNGYSIDIVKQLAVIGKNYTVTFFSFNAKLFNKAIRHLPYSELTFSPVQDQKGWAYYFNTKEDENFLGIIMGFGK